MRIFFYAILLTIFLASCKKEKKEQQSVVNVTPVKQAGLFESESSNGKVLLLSDKLSVYHKSGRITGDAKGLYGLTLLIDSLSTRRIDIAKSGDMCNEFNFVKVNSPKINGWVYDANVFQYGNNDTIFTAGSVKFKMYFAKNFGVGSSNDDGLTFCENIRPVVLYNSKYNVEAFIPLKDETQEYPSKFLVIDGHDGWSDKIKEISFEKDKLKLIVYREYQEGSAYFTILISLLDKGYLAVVTDVISDTEKYMDEN